MTIIVNGIRFHSYVYCTCTHTHTLSSLNDWLTEQLTACNRYATIEKQPHVDIEAKIQRQLHHENYVESEIEKSKEEEEEEN